jgi:mannose-6-phosphate isomerase
MAVTEVQELAPFRIEPEFVSRVWGERDLRPWYDHVVESGDPIGEVWLTGDACLVATGAHAGKTLAELFAQMPEALLGRSAPRSDSPLLIKMIFAKDKLSVQVHPDDRMAQKYGDPRGKTECWYVVAAEPGAQVACGLKPGVTLEKIKQGIHDGTLEESLNVLDIAAGEMIFVDAGTVHAIWPGSVLLETQQNCDLTYRMYDYGRPRQLHIEKSLEATKLVTKAGKITPLVEADRTILINTELFRVERVKVERSRSSDLLAGAGNSEGSSSDPGLAYLFAAAGSARITGLGFETVDLPERGIAAIPAAAPTFVVEDAGGLDLIRITPIWPERGGKMF